VAVVTMIAGCVKCSGSSRQFFADQLAAVTLNLEGIHVVKALCNNCLARFANLPEGLEILLALIYFFFSLSVFC